MELLFKTILPTQQSNSIMIPVTRQIEPYRINFKVHTDTIKYYSSLLVGLSGISGLLLIVSIF